MAGVHEPGAPRTKVDVGQQLYLVYVSGRIDKLGDDPEVVALSEDLFLVRTAQTRSQLYHSLKRRTSPDRLLVAPLSDTPKFMGMEAGSTKKAKALGLWSFS